MAIYPSPAVINLLYLDKLRSLSDSERIPMGRPHRFRLPNPASAPPTTRDTIIDFTFPHPTYVELPTVHPAVYHNPYRFAYGITTLDPPSHQTFADALIKLDMSASSFTPSSSSTETDSPPLVDGEPALNPHKIWHLAGHTPSEPIFVPRPGGTAEDDGVILSVVLDEEHKRSALVVLDAMEMREIARAEMKDVFPIGFHGVWSGGEVP